ncbi:MAG TPA: Rieske 2Fe-2S domain-containing protein [Candidatus Limnocylindria bacterium]|nr:Rieske 2Fe-2S domain-containing protein [Candidatus Limnocylindria bacterium]
MIRPHADTSIQAGGLLGRIKRRQLLRLGFLGATLLVTAEIGGLLLPFMRVNKIVGLGAKIPAGKKADILAKFQANKDDPQLFTEGKFFLLHPPGGIIAAYRKCTHLGCSVPYTPGERSPDGEIGQFHCPCHGSLFNKKTAIVQGGPAPKPLQLFHITEDAGGTLIVDTNPLNVIDRQKNEWDPAVIEVRDA